MKRKIQWLADRTHVKEGLKRDMAGGLVKSTLSFFKQTLKRVMTTFFRRTSNWALFNFEFFNCQVCDLYFDHCQDKIDKQSDKRQYRRHHKTT